jgi:hypothetical protein
MKKALLPLALAALVSGISAQAHAWAAGWKYVTSVEYKYNGNTLNYAILRLSDTPGGAQTDFVYLGQNQMCNASGSYNLSSYADLVKVLNSAEEAKATQKKVYVENYTNDMSCNNEKLLRSGHNFRFATN